MRPLLISFYTDDADYPVHGERLRGECDALGIEHRVERRESAGGYLENCCQKPFFIREVLREVKRPVLWIDVDATILREPKFVNELTCDFAARPQSRVHWRAWHVGTLWMNYTDNMLRFLDAWCDNTGALSDESALEVTWQENQHLLVVEQLPPAYFVLPSMMVKKPCIVHRISKWPGKDAQRHRFGK